MCKRLLLLCLYSLVFVVSSTKAQNPFFISLTENSGLPSNAVYHTFQDSKKYIWLATEKGLSRYDGVSFTSFDMEGESSLAGSNISEDKYGRIWYQSFDGFCYYVENDSLHKLNHKQISSFQPFAILGNHLFLITTNNIEIYDLSNLRIKKRVKFTDNQRIQHCIGYNSNFFLIDGQVIYKIDSSLKPIAFPKQLASSKNDYRLFVSNNRVYLVEKYNKIRKLYVLDTDNYYEAADIPEPEFIQGVSNINNQYWIHSNYGTYIFNQKGLVKHIFKEYNISNALVDASGNIWISSINKGIVIVPNANIEAFPFENTAKHLQVTKNGCIISFDNNTLVAYNSDFSGSTVLFKHQAKETMRKFLFDEEQKRLFVLAERLTIYDKNFRLTESSVLSVKDLIKLDAQYYAFAATSVIGIIKLNDNSIKTSSFDKLYNTLPQQAPNFKNIQTDFRGKAISYNPANQTFVYSNNKGTFAYSVAGQKEIFTPNGKTLYAKKFCHFGTQIFALTNDYKLYKINIDLKTELLNSMPVVGLKKIEAFEISENKLIIAGGNRVILLNPNNLTETYFNNTLPINIIDVLCFGVHNNTLILLKPETLLKIEIDNKLRNDKTADLFINSIFVNNKKAELTDNLILGYNENNVQVFFTYLDYLKLADNELYYSIDNKNWTQIEPGQRSIKFLSLASGTYQLRFKVNDLLIKDGIQIAIKLPFWKKPVFIFTSLMLFLVIILFVYRWQMNSLVRKNKLMEEKFELEKELNRSVLTSIKSQLNPHFFYNALNTIQSFVYMDDRKNASNYLGRFSKLTRTILEMSEKETISLKEEIEALTLYLELEKMRFEDTFSFEINYQGVDAELENIPPMLIQPYVENAVKHGLLHKKGNKILKLTFIKNGNFITVSVDDNGIGRKKSSEINKLKNPDHKSFAMAANEKRLGLLSSDKNSSLMIQFIDKMNDDETPAGTTVLLQIPTSLN